MHRGILCSCIIFMGCNERFNNSFPIKIGRKYRVSSPVIKVITQAIFVHQKYHIFYKIKRIILDRQELVPDASLKKFTKYGRYSMPYEQKKYLSFHNFIFN